MKIVNAGYQKTNYYLLDSGTTLLAVDTGWPGTYFDYARRFKECGYLIKDLKYLIVTHFHVDHAGLAEELMSYGVEFIVFPNQINQVQAMEAMIQKKMKYNTINFEKVINWNFEDSRKRLKNMNIDGEVIPTPGHSDDSITLILDEGVAFTGDLNPESYIMDVDLKSKESWKKIRERKVTLIKPGHGLEYSL